ncbi:MAG: inositol monophosphatase family protein, partial [Pseudomonadota bacterium]
MPLTEGQAAAIIAATRDVAAAEILPRFRDLSDGDVDAKSTFDDLVTVADTAAEAALTDRIHDILPGDTVIGE